MTMKLNMINVLFYIFLTTVNILALPQAVFAQDFTNAYICAPKNPGGEETRLYFRQTDGVAVNLSRNATFPVVCPIVVDYSDFSHDVGVRVGNANDFTQRVACALEEYDGGANLARTYGRSKSLPADFTDSILWEDIRLSSTNTGNYLVVRCILPPLGYITSVAWD